MFTNHMLFVPAMDRLIPTRMNTGKFKCNEYLNLTLHDSDKNVIVIFYFIDAYEDRRSITVYDWLNATGHKKV